MIRLNQINIELLELLEDDSNWSRIVMYNLLRERQSIIDILNG